MSTRKVFWSNLVRTFISLALTIVSFNIFPVSLWLITFFLVVATLFLAYVSVRAFKDISRGSGHTRQRPLRRD